MKKLISGSIFALVLVLAGCASSPPPAIGSWDISLEVAGLGSMNAQLTLAEDGTGIMEVPGMGAQALSGIMYDGDSVTFSSNVDAQGQAMTLVFNGMVSGDTLMGQLESPMGPISISGTRQ